MTAYQWCRQIIAESSESDRSSSMELTHHQLHWCMTIDDSLSVVQIDHCWNQWKWQIFITGTNISSVTLMHDHWQWQLISGADRSLLKPVKVTDLHHWNRHIITLIHDHWWWQLIGGADRSLLKPVKVTDLHHWNWHIITLIHDHWWWQLIGGADRSLLKPVKVTDHHSGKITSCHHWRNLWHLCHLWHCQ